MQRTQRATRKHGHKAPRVSGKGVQRRRQSKPTTISVAKIVQKQADAVVQKHIGDKEKPQSFLKWVIHNVMLLLHTLLLGQKYAGRLDFNYIEDDCMMKSHFPTSSKSFQAIMWKLTNIKDDRVWRLRQESVHTNVYPEPRITYEIMQDDIIAVAEDVHVQRSFCVKPYPSAHSTGTLRKYLTELSVFSKFTHTASDLIRLVDSWTDEHQEFLLDKEQKTHFMFVLRSKKSFLDEGAQILQMEFLSTRTFDNFFFKDKEKILHEVDFFMYNKDWYKDMGVPETLGILLHGEPGCGKTSFIKALLNYTGRHGVVVSLNSRAGLMAIEEIMGADCILNLPIPQDKRIYILEDIDAMGDLVCDREKKTAFNTDTNDDGFFFSLVQQIKQKNDADHLSTVLNLLDGIVEHTGRIIVMTTNHLEKLDPALVRPGRVDINAAFKRCDRPVLAQILSNFYQCEICESDIPVGVVSEFLTPAQIVQICKAHKLNSKIALSVMQNICDTRDTQPNSDDNLLLHAYKKKLDLKDNKNESVRDLEIKWEAKLVEKETCNTKDITFGMHKLKTEEQSTK